MHEVVSILEVPGIIVTGPEGGIGGKSDDNDEEDNNPIYAATLKSQRTAESVWT